RLPLILTSSVAINYGSKMSTEGWPVQISFPGVLDIMRMCELLLQVVDLLCVLLAGISLDVGRWLHRYR
ncbi:hypothetical protein DF161_35780, partial [Burkholderia stagnalis]